MNQLIIQSDPENPVLHLSGRIDAVNSSQLDTYLKTLPTSDLYLVLDLSACSYISSAGIRILLITHKEMLVMGGRLYLAALLPEIVQILEMTGLQRIFHIVETVAKALECIKQLSTPVKNHMFFEFKGKPFVYQLLDREPGEYKHWDEPGLISYAELGFSFGMGIRAELWDDESEQFLDLFMTAGNIAAFVNDDQPYLGDFQIVEDPTRSSIKVIWADSFGNTPTRMLKSLDNKGVHLNDFYMLCRVLNDELVDEPIPTLIVVLSTEPCLSVSVILVTDETDGDLVISFGIRFVLDEAVPVPECDCLEWLKKVLTYENVLKVENVKDEKNSNVVHCWMFVADGWNDANAFRLRIQTEEGLQLTDEQDYLVHKLYADSSRVKLSLLHGGYSAETFQVESYDKFGRKMRPTVLKIANRAMISRESERCQLYSQPYIYNNSAAVLGTEFHGNTGALHYNFVGIDGYDTKLRWLTHDFHQLSVEELLPLFDKVFLQILQPWYGQPVQKTIFPFKDHDPTLTFFPHIYNVVSELFGISADEEYIYAEELGREVLNPYWYLKHRFPQQREEGLLYWESICHGDLNMQNILLDEHQNVYLIDFSETKPRAVVSDFARLEAIFMIDNAQINQSEDMSDYLSLILPFYQVERLDEQPAVDIEGLSDEKLRKILTLTRQMRHYALGCVGGDPNIVPYYLALLEWVMPIVCYNSVSIAQKRLSMLVSALLCEKIRRARGHLL